MMERRGLFLSLSGLLLALVLPLHLFFGFSPASLPGLALSLVHFEVNSYEDAVLLFQRLPRSVIAVYAGSIAAASGFVLQSLVRNPLASPATLGVNSGAALFLVAAALLLDADAAVQGLAALAGAITGFLACLAVARFAGRRNDPRGLSLILSGALVSMLFTGMTNALLLSDPARRADFLSWVTGNINHVYIDRLAMFWWIGAAAVLVLLLLARPLTLILFGEDKAASAGVNVPLVSRAAITAAVLGTGSAVAVCGPIGFVGLVIPHIVRPFAGNNLVHALPASLLCGASACLLADLLAREAFQPFVINTGLVTDLVGGIVFIVIVKRFYLSAGSREAA
ncbi:iron complex transport system permease protein [Roseibium suaedae]|uniref:Iron complex transport system permease protein n=2 Tax=Roseibium suaedae TaxID=735517 RepID=A0A1M7MVG2_9HYPH|nr:iron ABC transporter permease [Roseibium suaedae]SHM95153.1 iron complex transport system permease protein [Roseibium suaedae]